MLAVYPAAFAEEGEGIDQVNSRTHKNKQLVQMDIMTIMGKENEFFEEEGEAIKKHKKARAAVSVPDKTWSLPIRYKFEESLSYSGRKAIKAAMYEYSEKTCIHFVEKNDEDIDYLSFVQKGGCWSYVGRIGGKQQLSLDAGCHNKRVAIHEIMHALGFLHEQSRPDRDNYVRINYENVIESQRLQFKKAKQEFVHDLGVPYDYVSVMHYGRKAFSRNSKDTITPLNSRFQQLGQSSNDGVLTSHDIAQLNMLYKCGEDVAKPACYPSCNKGKCLSANFCLCPYGWSGLQCDVAMCNPSCAHGECHEPNTCKCEFGWEGRSCNTRDTREIMHNYRCFPSDAYVRSESGLQVELQDVKVGDKVLTMDTNGNPMYSTINMMMHRDMNQTIDDYVTITTKDGVHLTLSSYHLIPLSSSAFVFGKDVKPGDNVTVYDKMEKRFKISEVVSVKYVTKRGLYAPLSMEGTLIVNDVYVSCYASYPSHSVSHAMFFLWRVLYQHFQTLLTFSTDVDGLHWYPSMMKNAALYFNILTL